MNTKTSPTSRTAAKKATPAKPTAKKAAPKKVAPKKAAPKPAAAPAPQAALQAKVKHKLVRDSFTIPKSEYLLLEALKHRAANLKQPIKKSELLRAGIAALTAMSDKAFLTSIKAVPSLKTGRPAKHPAH